MAKVAKRTFSLSAKHAEFIDTKVTSGDYGSASEVIRAGLRALQERDEAMELWLKKEVAPTYDSMKATLNHLTSNPMEKWILNVDDDAPSTVEVWAEAVKTIGSSGNRVGDFGTSERWKHACQDLEPKIFVIT